MGIGSALALVPTGGQRSERREALRRFDSDSKADPGSPSVTGETVARARRPFATGHDPQPPRAGRLWAELS